MKRTIQYHSHHRSLFVISRQTHTSNHQSNILNHESPPSSVSLSRQHNQEGANIALPTKKKKKKRKGSISDSQIGELFISETVSPLGHPRTTPGEWISGPIAARLRWSWKQMTENDSTGVGWIIGFESRLLRGNRSIFASVLSKSS